MKFWGNGFKKIYSNVSDQFLFYVFFLLLFFVNILNNNHVKGQPLSCDKSRKVFYDRSGIIADGPIGSNYTQDSHCEWLIRGKTNKIIFSFVHGIWLTLIHLRHVLPWSLVSLKDFFLIIKIDLVICNLTMSLILKSVVLPYTGSSCQIIWIFLWASNDWWLDFLWN